MHKQVPKALRVASGVKQKDAAKALGIAVYTIQEKEAGKSSWKFDEIEKLAELYGVPLSAFASKTPEESIRRAMRQATK